MAGRKAKSSDRNDQLRVRASAKVPTPALKRLSPFAIFAAALAGPAIAPLGDPGTLDHGSNGTAQDRAWRAGNNGPDASTDGGAGHMSFTCIPRLRSGRQSRQRHPSQHRSAQVHWKTPLFKQSSLTYPSRGHAATGGRVELFTIEGVFSHRTASRFA